MKAGESVELSRSNKPREFTQHRAVYPFWESIEYGGSGSAGPPRFAVSGWLYEIDGERVSREVWERELRAFLDRFGGSTLSAKARRAYRFDLPH